MRALSICAAGLALCQAATLRRSESTVVATKEETNLPGDSSQRQSIANDIIARAVVTGIGTIANGYFNLYDVMAGNFGDKVSNTRARLAYLSSFLEILSGTRFYALFPEKLRSNFPDLIGKLLWAWGYVSWGALNTDDSLGLNKAWMLFIPYVLFVTVTLFTWVSKLKR